MSLFYYPYFNFFFILNLTNFGILRISFDELENLESNLSILYGL